MYDRAYPSNHCVSATGNYGALVLFKPLTPKLNENLSSFGALRKC